MPFVTGAGLSVSVEAVAAVTDGHVEISVVWAEFKHSTSVVALFFGLLDEEQLSQGGCVGRIRIGRHLYFGQDRILLLIRVAHVEEPVLLIVGVERHSQRPALQRKEHSVAEVQEGLGLSILDH